MRPAGLVRRLGLLLLGLAPLPAAGCLAGYVYPKISYVPGLVVEAPWQDVHAFAVHIRRETALSLPPSPRLTLKPLPQTNRVGAQAELTLERGYWLWGGMRISEHVRHDLGVRLYRQGYHTVDVGSWTRFDGVHWLQAQGPGDREQAIDDLLGRPPEGDGPAVRAELATLDHLEPGSTDREHRQALLFAAAEYEALARSPGLDAPMRQRLLDKARKARDRAEQ